MWNRGYISRLRTDQLSWTPMAEFASGFAPGTSVRLLSRDVDDGASTCLWRIPAGWRHRSPFVLDGGEALFVVAGYLRKGSELYEEGCYAYRPAGFVHETMFSEHGATVLTMWDAAIVLRPPQAHAALREEPILRIDTGALAARPTFVEGPVPGITVKLLRTVAETGGMTLLVTIPGGWTEPRSEHHDCVEESFKLLGSIELEENGRRHVLAARDYFFRPPRIKHGPMFSESGTTSLIRFSSEVVNHYGPVSDR